MVDFRLHVGASFTFRADALFELVDALLVSPLVCSAVEVSQSPLFRRRFASVYDALTAGQINPTVLRRTLAAAPEDALTVAGSAVYARDTPIAPRPDARTEPDRSMVSSAAPAKAIPGHPFSWLGRVIAWGKSWLSPRVVGRVPTSSTPGEIGAAQVRRLAADPTPPAPKVVTADSHSPVPSFRRAFVGSAPGVVLLARLAANRVVHGPPPPPTGKRGWQCRHGATLSLPTPGPPDRPETAWLFGREVRLSAWVGYNVRKVPTLGGVVVGAEFLTADGIPSSKRPLWLFWSGSPDVALADVVTMSLLRDAIEHFFRFLK